MEVIKLDICGYYYYKPDFEIKKYADEESKNEKDCIICKRSLYDPSYDQITDNSKLQNSQEIIIGKCGHCYHSDCMTKLVLVNNNLKSYKNNSHPNNLKRFVRKNKLIT